MRKVRGGRGVRRAGTEGWLSEEERKEKQLMELESQLEAAVQLERYTDAARLRDEIKALHDDAVVAVLSANFAFYTAFERRDILEMQKVWFRGDEISVIHPLHGVTTGLREVMASWNKIFQVGEVKVTATDVRVVARGCTAFVTCTEKLSALRDGDDREGIVIATNIFQYRNGEWLMLHHHGSPVLG